VSAELTHYDLLGVDADAAKDDIRAAYQDKLANVRAARTKEEETKRPSEDVLRAARDEEARLRSAWQVLSDPVQRERYDHQVGVDDIRHPDDDDDDDDDDESDDDEEEAELEEAPQRPERAQSLVTAEGLEIPATGRRVTAAAIDAITMIAIWAAIVYPLVLGAGLTKGLPALITQVGTMEFVIVAFLIIPVWRGGQTLGKRYTYTMIVDRATGELPDLAQVIRRYIIPAFVVALLYQTGAVIALIFGLSFLMNREQVSLADRFAKTAVVIARYRPERSA
jgi:uncharacterized RDD family membrane protein YckC